MNKNQEKEITIAELSEKLVSTGNTVVKIVTTPAEGRKHGDKYQFWKLHKGVESDAYKGMKKGVGVGSKVMIEYTEEDKKFTPIDGHNEGTEITFKERTIWKFKGDEHGVPYTAETPVEANSMPMVATLEPSDEVKVINIDDEITAEDLPF